MHPPAHHTRLVEVTMTGKDNDECLLFEAACDCLAEQGLVIDDGVVQPAENG